MCERQVTTVAMDPTVSVSKGVFLFKNGSKKIKHCSKETSLFERWFKKEPWYTAYRHNWTSIENAIQDMNNKTYSILLNDIVNYVKSFNGEKELEAMDGIIPSATLLTGVNQPDHVSQFVALIHKIREEVTPHLAMVNSQDAPTLKHLIENVVWQLIHGHVTEVYDPNLDDSMNQKSKKLRKNQCAMSTLKSWYNERYHMSTSIKLTPKKKKLKIRQKSLVVIIPDFESFSCAVLQDFVMIMSSYVSSLPIVLIFGVATSVSALHKSFPYHVSSKLLIKVFHSHSSPVYMNQVLEDIFLSHTSPFHLSGRAVELLTDVFLFYDFSVTGLIQSIKYCMMEHYYGDNTKSLCTTRNLDDVIAKLTPEDLENIRQLPSFRSYLEAQDCRTKISLFENDDFFKEKLHEQMTGLRQYLFSFYTCLRLLWAFVKDLPKNILGRTVREMYTKCAAETITTTEGFKECMQLLNFQSQVKLVDTLKSALKVVNNSLQHTSPIKPLRNTPTKSNVLKENALTLKKTSGESFIKSVRVHIITFLSHVQSANTEVAALTNKEADSGEDFDMENVPRNRYKLKEKLLKATRVERVHSEYELVRSRLLSYLQEVFASGLQPPHTRAFHEVLFFSDVSAVRKQLVGSPRGAVHTALSNPDHYLQCTCCRLPSPESIVHTLPDVSLAYKLHRECGRHINLYDWLQAFAAVLQPSDEDERRHVDPAIQVRFTRAVAELQFLGFIKSSKRKTDHVMRLTW